MKIAIAAFNIEKATNSQYYNSQQEGLGKALARLGYDVHVYHFVDASEKPSTTSTSFRTQEDNDSTHSNYSLPTKKSHPQQNDISSQNDSAFGNNRLGGYTFTSSIIPCERRGVHAMPDNSVWDADTDLLIAFSDKSTGFPKTYKFMKSKGIPVIPYIGVLRSHNPSAIKRFISDLTSSNMKYYKKIAANPNTPIIAKTPALADELAARGISNLVTIPVGLDEDLLKKDYADYDKNELRKEFFANIETPDTATSRENIASPSTDQSLIQPNTRILLYIGRLTAEKQPLTLLEIFRTLLNDASKKSEEHSDTNSSNTGNINTHNYHLIMIGKGELQPQIDAFLSENPTVKEHVTLIPSYPNQNIWKLFRMSDIFINLNQQEIFGMALLESMYYECPVVAFHAPGPDSILGPVSPRMLCDHSSEIVEKIQTYPYGTEKATEKLSAAHEYIIINYLWTSSAYAINQLLQMH